MKTLASEPSSCPNPECTDDEESDVVLTHEDGHNSRHWVVCNDCWMEGPCNDDAELAVQAWNNLPREIVSNDSTIATLVRMLDETRDRFISLEAEYLDLQGQHEQCKKEQLWQPPVSTNTPVVNNINNSRLQQVGQMKGITLHGADVVPNLEKEVQKLTSKLSKSVSTCDKQAKLIEKSKEDLFVTNKELRRLMNARTRESGESYKLKTDYKNSLMLIDLALVSIELAKDDDTIAPIVGVQDLLDSIRSDDWPPTAAEELIGDTPMTQLIKLCSPHGKCPVAGIYLEALAVVLSKEALSKDRINCVYGLVMERFAEGSPGYLIAWEALGRPGETKHVARPRT